MSRRSKGLNFNRRRHHIEDENISETIKMIFWIAAAILTAWVLAYCFGSRTEVIGSSMEPSFYNGQTVMISRLSYMLGRPKEGDVVVFLPYGNQNTHYYIKRVIAVPGDVVEIRSGRIYINDIEYEGEVEYDKIADAGMAANPITLGEGEYFVLGDNVNASEDSRSGNIGMVTKEMIEGRVWFRLPKGDSHMGFVR